MPVSSIYIGGGTPTSLAPGQLTRVLEYLIETFHVIPQAEISVEASPDTVTLEGHWRGIAKVVSIG